MDPKDILGEDLHLDAALPSPHDIRDHQWEEVGYGAAPFDWNVGYDIEAEVSKVLGTPFKEPTKNQGTSSSCGGQAVSYLGGTFSILQNRSFVEKSAKFIYAPIAYPNGGGTVGRDLCDQAVKIGWADETLCLSYNNSLPPNETFMARVADISPAAVANAAKNKALSYAAVNTDIDSVAQALANSSGLFIGVKGSNNGTWGSLCPLPPSDGDYNCWGHWMKVGKAKLINGVKNIGVHNSWGPAIGDNGWQWLSEDYFKSVTTNSNRPGPAIWEARVIIYNPKTTPPTFTHTFKQEMQQGDEGEEVKALQTALQINGTFPASVAPTGFYGNITVGSVQKFQAKYGIATAGLPTTTGYGRVGPRTLAKLNQLFSSGYTG
jgi:hypothetical protein